MMLIACSAVAFLLLPRIAAPPRALRTRPSMADDAPSWKDGGAVNHGAFTFGPDSSIGGGLSSFGKKWNINDESPGSAWDAEEQLEAHDDTADPAGEQMTAEVAQPSAQTAAHVTRVRPATRATQAPDARIPFTFGPESSIGGGHSSLEMAARAGAAAAPIAYPGAPASAADTAESDAVAARDALAAKTAAAEALAVAAADAQAAVAEAARAHAAAEMALTHAEEMLMSAQQAAATAAMQSEVAAADVAAAEAALAAQQ